MELIEKSLEIIEKTNDGDDLSPGHLYLVQEAVNGHLSDLGLRAFEELYNQIHSDNYQKPWLCGIEYLTIDHEGFVYWKGHEIEHWNMNSGTIQRWKKEALELSRRCTILESQNKEINCESVIWYWQD
jgi:hypothetical protein